MKGSRKNYHTRFQFFLAIAQGLAGASFFSILIDLFSVTMIPEARVINEKIEVVMNI